MDFENSETIEDEHLQFLQLMGSFLIIGFFFPVMAAGFRGSKIFFPNISLLGKGDIFSTINLLYPLIAGIVLILISKNLHIRNRSYIILLTGLFPILVGIIAKNSLLSSSIGRFNTGTFILFFIMISLIGIFVGSKLISERDHVIGRIMGGVSGLLFIVLMLLPIGYNGQPFFLFLIDFFKFGGIGKGFGSLVILGLALVAIFICYIYAAIIAISNFSQRPKSMETASNACKLIYYASISLPISIFITVILSGAGFMIVVSTLIKLFFIFCGIISTISMGLQDLIMQMIPKTVTGKNIFTRKFD